MKLYLTLILGLTLSFWGNSQSLSTYILNQNNAEAIISDGGVFFNNAGTNNHGYSVPAGSQQNVMYALAFWYGGIDINGQLKLSAQNYANFNDQFKGPLTADGTAEADQSGNWLTALFPVSQSEITTHLANYTNAGYVPSSNIASWPAHGDLSLNQDYYLAPFVDVDGDGTYNPLAGDYPCIRGDEAVYVIMNDKGDIHESGGDPIGLEMHYMFYQYTGAPEISNTTFVSLKIINRGTQTISDFKVSTFMDGDIGFYGDDYIGSDSSRNMMFFYNGDAFDEGGGGTLGYGDNPPAVGLVSLANDFQSIGIADASENSAVSFWRNMNGTDQNGSDWIDPISMGPTSYIFPADPGDLTWPNSEVGLMTPVGDRRGVATIDIGTLVPFSEHTFDYAVIYNREDSAGNVNNASGLRNVADIVQEFFDTSFVDDCLYNNTLSLENTSKAEFSIFPNPSQGEFTISLAADFSNTQLEIVDISGRVVLSQLELTSKETSIQLNQPSGVYLLHLIVDGYKMTKRIILG